MSMSMSMFSVEFVLFVPVLILAQRSKGPLDKHFILLDAAGYLRVWLHVSKDLLDVFGCIGEPLQTCLVKL